MAQARSILLLEDEEALRLLVRKALEKEGYIVLSAGDSVAASQLVREHSGNVDLLLSDINLPGLTGGEFASFLKSFQTGVKIIYMSGEPQDPVADLDIRQKEAGFLQKPFSLGQLMQMVKEALGEI